MVECQRVKCNKMLRFLGCFSVLLQPDEKKALKIAISGHLEKQEKRKRNFVFNK